MQAYFGERGCEFDQASGILDSNSEEAWRETKMRPSSQYGGELTTASSKTKTPALQAIVTENAVSVWTGGANGEKISVFETRGQCLLRISLGRLAWH